MKIINVNELNAGQRLDKFLLRYFNTASKATVYKLMRKKLIKLNGKKAEGGELLTAGDIIGVFLSDETAESMSAPEEVKPAGGIDIVYEDENVLICAKPAGVLCHPEAEGDGDTMVHKLAYHLQRNGRYDPEDKEGFRPALVNRLDRNTGGLVICAVNLAAARELSEALRERSVKRLYLAQCEGLVKQEQTLRGLLEKDGAARRTIAGDSGAPSECRIKPLRSGGGSTLLEVELITGRFHQIRAQLSSIGHPICGDAKYGSKVKLGGMYRLFAYRLVFGGLNGRLEYLNGREFAAKPPEWGHLNEQ